MATTFTARLGLPQITVGYTGWGAAMNARLAALDARLGDFAVRETDIDPATGLATSLNYTVAAGTYFLCTGATRDAFGQNFLSGAAATAAAGTTGTAAANATTFLWLNDDGSFGTDTGSYLGQEGGDLNAPLARIVADGTKILEIIDDRHRVGFVKDAPRSYQQDTSTAYSFHPAGAAVSDFSLYAGTPNVRTVVRVDCTGGPIAVTLPAWSSSVTGVEFVVKKIDASANAVTVHAAGGDTIDAATTATISTARGVLHLYARSSGESPPGWDII